MNTQDEIKQRLITIWEEIFDLSSISQEDFFSLGGNSLSAVKISVRIKEHFSVELSVKDIFEKPTIDEQVAAITEHQKNMDENSESECFEI